MDLRKAFLKPFKKLKGKLPGGRRKGDGGSGSESDRGSGETGVEGSGASQRTSFMHSAVDVRSALESRPTREGKNVDGKEAAPVDDPLTSTPSISQSDKPNSM